MRELFLFALLPVATSCQVQGSCETPTIVEYCAAANDPSCQGQIITVNGVTFWESGPQNGAFLSYSAEQLYHLHFRDAQTGQVASGDLANLYVQVSASQQGNATNWINGADQLSEGTYDLDRSGMFLRNDTCGSYYFRAVATLIPNTSTDAGTD